MTDQGCKRARDFPFGHVLDSERRRWACGATEHLASQCPRKDGKQARTAKAALKSAEKDSKASASKVTADDKEAGDEKEEAVEDTMQLLLQKANKMPQSVDKGEAGEKKASLRPSQVHDLQRQLDMLKKTSLKPFQISRMGGGSKKGLLDSGATHPLFRERKKNEQVDCLPKVRVSLAGEKEADMRLTPTGVIIGEAMALLTSLFGCQVSWSPEGLRVVHPKSGPLKVDIEDGCPLISKDVALSLIDEMEKITAVEMRSLSMGEDSEMKFLQRMVDEHPVFRSLPDHIKQALVEVPDDDVKKLANRRTRKLWKREGVVVHAFSGSKDGCMLRRAVHEVGDRRKVYEFDVIHGQEKDALSPKGMAYKLALSGQGQAWVGGPPCRTRSVLRHVQA